MEKQTEKICWKAKWQIDKFNDPAGEVAFALQAGLPLATATRIFKSAFLESEQIESNIALNEGLGELIDLLCGLGSPTAYSNANARLGVGDSNASEAATQTGLQASTNKTFKAMDSGYPARTNQTVEFRATFGGSEANYSWQEYTVVNASSDAGKNLNRKVADKGTKASGETWTLSLQITFS